MKTRFLTLFAVAASALLASDVLAVSTYLQVSGAECYAITFEANFARTDWGFRNDSASAITVECPIADGVDDSNPVIHTYSGAEIYMTGGQLTNCYIGVVGTTGSLTWSSAFTYNANYKTMRQNGGVGANAGTGAFIQCLVPAGATLRGATLSVNLHDVTGGV